MTRTELMAFIDDAERKVERYGWKDRNVHPYGYPVKLTKVLADLKSYDECTSGSKEYLKALASGLKPILEAWEAHEHEPKVKVRINKTGKIREVSEDMLELFEGLVTVI